MIFILGRNGLAGPPEAWIRGLSASDLVLDPPESSPQYPFYYSKDTDVAKGKAKGTDVGICRGVDPSPYQMI